MSRSRKRRGRGPGQPQGARRGRATRKDAEFTRAGFWGDRSVLPAERPAVRRTGDPAATVRSLGPPPLPGHETIAEHYFAAVYDRAVALAGALAAVSGLTEPEEPRQDED